MLDRLKFMRARWLEARAEIALARAERHVLDGNVSEAITYVHRRTIFFHRAASLFKSLGLQSDPETGARQ